MRDPSNILWPERVLSRVRSLVEQGWWLILGLLLGTTVFFAAALPRLDINANTDAFLEEESSGVSTYYEAREEWGTDEFAVLCVTADDWFTEEGVARLLAIETDLRAVAFVSSTMSILDVPLLRQEPGEKPTLAYLFTGMKSLRTEGIDLSAAAQEHGGHELTVGNLISSDGRSLNILAYLDWSKVDGKVIPPINERRTGLVHGVREVAAKWDGRLDEPVRLSGIPIIQITLFENMRHDLIVFGVVSVVLFAGAFFFVYRRLRFVVLPLACCLLPPIGILGGMAYFGIPVGFVTANMPLLLFVLLLPYSVYFIERYRERRAQIPDEDGLASTLGALQRIAVPCLFSCATTMAGFGALGASKIIPIRDFGRSMTLGVAVGLVVFFVFMAVASRCLRGLEVGAGTPAGENRRVPRLVGVLARLSLARPGLVVACSGVLLVGSVAGMLRMSAESKITSYFWPNSAVYQGLEFIDQTMGGTTWLEVIFRAEEGGYFKSAEGLRAVETVEAYFEGVPETGNIMSLVRLRDEMRKTFRPEWFPGLSDSALLRAMSIASSDLVRQTTNREFTNTRLTVRIKETAPGLNRQDILDGLQRHLDQHGAVLAGIEIEVTGVFPVYNELLQQLMVGQKESIAVVVGAVLVMLLILFRSPVLAVLVLIPQVLPAAVVLGLMGWMGLPLDLVTVMIASIAIGVGIDAAIQYTMRFRRELEASGDRRLALQRTHATTGRAIWIATTIIIAGFSILVLSDFFPSVWFGLFTALAMLISQLATLTVLPSLFLLTGYPRGALAVRGRGR